jgi:uncharacterized membrane protein YjfL (UPF0719 family)
MYTPLIQGLPPIPDNSLDVARLLLNMGLAVAWTIVASICFAIAFLIGMRIFDSLFPGLDKIEELKKGNVAVALVIAAFGLGLTAIVVAILLK